MLHTCNWLAIFDSIFGASSRFILKLLKGSIHNTVYKKRTLQFLEMKDIDQRLKIFFVESYIDEIINFKALYKINVILFTFISWGNFILASVTTFLLGLTNSKYLTQQMTDIFNWSALIVSSLLIIGNRLKASGNYEREYLMNMSNAYMMETEIRKYLGRIDPEYSRHTDYDGIIICMRRLEYIKKNSMGRDKQNRGEDEDDAYSLTVAPSRGFAPHEELPVHRTHLHPTHATHATEHDTDHDVHVIDVAEVPLSANSLDTDPSMD